MDYIKKKPDPERTNCRACRTRPNVAGAGWTATLAMLRQLEAVLLGPKTSFPTPTLKFLFLNKE